MQKPHAVDTNICCRRHVRAYAQVCEACSRIRLKRMPTDISSNADAGRQFYRL